MPTIKVTHIVLATRPVVIRLKSSKLNANSNHLQVTGYSVANLIFFKFIFKLVQITAKLQ